MEDGLLTRSGATARFIARDLAGRASGDRIPSVTSYASEFKVGINTVQRALAYLQEASVIELEPRARSGTYISSLDRARLWSLAYGEPLVAFMPLPYSRRYEGLATGINEGLSQAAIPFRMAFMSGAMPRIESAIQTNGVAVVSVLALRSAQARHDVSGALELPPGTYVSAHGVIRRRRSRRARPVIGIDKDSVDQAALTRAEFGNSAIYEPVHYLQLEQSVRIGVIDAAVWSLDSVATDDQVTVEPLRSAEAIALDELATRAAFAVGTDNTAVARLLADCLQPQPLLAAQEAVVSGSRLPSY